MKDEPQTKKMTIDPGFLTGWIRDAYRAGKGFTAADFETIAKTLPDLKVGDLLDIALWKAILVLHPLGHLEVRR